MIIDGEILRLQCKNCGTKYKHIIGYGPICPSAFLRKEMLKEYPPKCPSCGSSDYKMRGLFGFLSDLFS